MVPRALDSKNAVRKWLPPGVDLVAGALLLVGWLVLYGTTYVGLSQTIWARDEQGHGPIILAVSLWMMWRLWPAVAELPARPSLGAGVVFFVISMSLYVVGRSQAVLLFEVGSQIPILMGMLLLIKGPRALRLCWLFLR